MAQRKTRTGGNASGAKENLRRFGKDIPPLTPELARKYGSMGGKKSAQKKKQQITLDKAFYAVMNKSIKGDLKTVMKRAGFEEEELDNAHAVFKILFDMALEGDKDAVKILVDYQKSLMEDARKSEESKARIESMKANAGTSDINITSTDDDDGGVVIYLPKIEEDEPDDIAEDGQDEVTEAEPEQAETE